MPLFTNIKTTLEMIKWEHSIFALPFALCAAMLAAAAGRGGFGVLVTRVVMMVVVVTASVMAGGGVFRALSGIAIGHFSLPPLLNNIP